MHAVVTHATINDQDAATANLQSDVVPTLKQAPGFVSAYFVAFRGDKGVSVVVWESEEAARTSAERRPPGVGVTFDTVEVGEVVASG
jgi:hypothetical protein